MTASRSLILTALVALAAPGCPANNDQVVLAVQDTVAAGHARGVILASSAFVDLTGDDYAVVIGKTGSILAAINSGEIDQSDFALQVVLDVDIADYARTLLADHTFSNADLDNVMRTFGVDFIPSGTEANVVSEFAVGLDDLRATPSADIDFAFIELQVRNHAASQVLLGQLLDMTRDDEMRRFIEDMQNEEDAHLVRASDLLATFQ